MNVHGPRDELNVQTPLPSWRVLAARARASNVFPVPGGPWKSTPLGGVIFKFLKRSGYNKGRSVISLSWLMSGVRCKIVGGKGNNF